MGSKKGLEVINAFVKKLKEANIFDSAMNKVKIVSAGDGKCTAEFIVEKEHTNMFGTVHGGFFATALDCVSTFAVMTSKKETPGVSVDMHISFMKGAQLGDEVLIEAKTIRAGNTLAFLDVVIKNKKTGQIYVTGSHTKFIA